jgi:rod shape-determining protein MreC
MQALFKDSKTFFILCLLSLFLLLADNFKLLNFPKSIVQTVAIPIQYGLYQSSRTVTRQFEFIFLARRSAQENKALKEQLAQVTAESANLRRQLAETQGFLEQQKALDPRVYDLVAARPISSSRYIRIDKGSDSGLKVGEPVVYKENYLGQIKQLSPKGAEVLLPTDPDSKIAAFVSNKDGKAKGILIGQFGSEMLLDKILHSESISIGDLIYSEGTEGVLPRGLVLGQVTSVLDRPNEIFKQANVKGIFKATDLDIVFVITN